LASAVWYRVYSWLGFFLVNPPNLFISFASSRISWAIQAQRKGKKVWP
jgi:hypothetical protein